MILVRAFVRQFDQLLADNYYGAKAAVAAAFVPFLLVPVVGTWFAIPATMTAVLWLTFVVWRGWRVTKAWAVKADRQYDRKDKFSLAAEYHSSESATAARRRGRG